MKVGLVCYGDIPTGLGTEARWMFCNLPLTWLQVQHQYHGWGKDYDNPNVRHALPIGNINGCLAEEFDGFLFVERPFLTDDTLAECKERGKKLVCIVMPEWLPPSLSWLPYIDRFIAFTQQGYEHCQRIGLGDRTVRLQQPVDLRELPYRQRTRVERMMYCDGWGGVQERKGWPEIQEANALGANIIIKSLRKNVGAAADTINLYADADAVVVPGKFDGVGLTLLEAMASGCIVLATDAPPYNEFLAAAYDEAGGCPCLLKVKERYNVRIWDHEWPAVKCDPADIADAAKKVRTLPTQEVLGYSGAGRKYIEQEHGAPAWKALWEAVTVWPSS